MFKFITFLAIAVACVSATPGAVLAGYAAPPVVTAQSSQFVARNYNGIAAPLVAAAPVVAAPLAAAPYYAQYAAPFKAAPLVASHPLNTVAVASPYYAPVAAPIKSAPFAAAPYYTAGPIAAPLKAIASAPYVAGSVYAPNPNSFYYV